MINWLCKRHPEAYPLVVFMQPEFKKSLVWLIVGTAVLRLIAASAVELGNDEVYYWTYSQHLEWSYFDHPPLVAVWIRLFTGNLWLQDHELFIRLGSIAGCAVCTWLMYKTGALLQSERAGWVAACLFNASLYASIIAGLFIMPDSPQMVFWCAALYALLKITLQPDRWRYWVWFGLCAGLCIMSKVHGVFLWFGFGLYILVQRRPLLKQPQLYVALLITAVIASPILFWNLQNHFVTYQYHSSRVTVTSIAIDPISFFREFFGQVLYNNPVVVVLSAMAVYAGVRRTGPRIKAAAVYLWIALPLIFLLLAIALFRDTLPHWSGPAYVTLLPLTAAYIDTRWKHVPKSVGWSLGLVLLTLFLGMGIIKSWPGTLGSQSPQTLGKGDFTLDMYGWRNAGSAFRKIYESDLQKGIIEKGTPLVCYKWFPAAHEEYYFCRPLGIAMIGLGAPFDLHQYTWRNRDRVFNAAYAIVPSQEYYNVREKYAAYFSVIDSVTEIQSYRSHKLASRFYVYRLQGFRKQ